MSHSFTGTAGVSTYQAIVLKSALKLYSATGIRPNRAWTPTKMLKLAEHITGRTFKRGEYMRAYHELGLWIERNGTAGE